MEHSVSLMDLVGNTPLLQIRQVRFPDVVILAKLEYCNPSGSVKDRAARGMLLAARESGQLNGRVLLEATSGNTGIALAMMAAELGVPVELALPENASEERKLILRGYGARLHLTDRLSGTDGAQEFARKLVEEHPDRYFYPDQYNNEANWRAHYTGTGPEIWAQTEGRVTHFVAGLGTSGTFTGTSRFLMEKNVECYSVQPDSPMHGLEGWKHMESAVVPGIYDPELGKGTIEAGTEEAFRTAIAAGRDLGLAISPSAAANLNAALKLAGDIRSGVIVTILADGAAKYLQDPFWTHPDYQDSDPFACRRS